MGREVTAENPAQQLLLEAEKARKSPCRPAPLLQHHGEDRDRQNQSLHRPEARHQRPPQAGQGVPGECQLRGEFHPEHYLHYRPAREAGGHPGGRGRWQVLHEGGHPADPPHRRRQWGKEEGRRRISPELPRSHSRQRVSRVFATT